MPYCYNCGVKLDDSQNICPLCGAKIPEAKLPSNKSISSEIQLNEEDIKKIDEKNSKKDFLYPLYQNSSENQK